MNPKLRFKLSESQSAWAPCRIGDILSVFHGKDYKGIPEGDIPVLATSGQIASVSRSLCTWPCALIGRKGTINKPQFMDSPFWSVDTLFYTKPKGNHHPKFQYYLFQTIDWMKYNEGSGVPSLSAHTIQKIKVLTPSAQEQEKIASFLSQLDSKIQLEEQKALTYKRLKQNLLADIISQKRTLLPLQKSKHSEWQVTTIREVTSICGGGTPSTSNLTYWNGDIQWLTPTEINSKFVHNSKRTITESGLKNSSAKLLPQGALLLTTRATLGACSINNFDGPICTNQGFQSLIPNDKIVGEYLYYVIQSPPFQKEMHTRASGSTFLEISPSNLKSIKIPLPSLKEQGIIADFLSSLDTKIELIEKRIQTTKKLKQALLQQMFV